MKLLLVAVVVAAEAFAPPSSQSRASVTSPPKTTKLCASVSNSAFVFVKPHAVTDATIDLVRDSLLEAGITVKSEGDISSETIDSKKLVDQHYYAIASKATITPPEELAVPEDKFEDFFGEKWPTVLAEGRAKTAIDAGKALKLDGAAMDEAWGKAKDDGKIIKLGGGFYCGRLSDEVYTFNAFYMSMRDRFTAPGGEYPVTSNNNPTLKKRGRRRVSVVSKKERSFFCHSVQVLKIFLTQLILRVSPT